MAINKEDVKSAEEKKKKALEALNKKGDIASDLAYRQAEKSANTIKADYQRSRWYGSEDVTDTTVKAQPDTLLEKITESAPAKAIGKFFNTLAVPQRMLVGAVEKMTGTGNKEGLWDNMVDNAFNEDERDGFSDILKKKGVNNWLSMPVGFALDVALDPLNILVPGSGLKNIATGTAKAGLKGANLGAKLSMANTFNKAVDIGTGIGKLTAGNIGKLAGKGDDVVKAITTAGSKLKLDPTKLQDMYNTAIGFDPIADAINRTGKVSGAIEEGIRKVLGEDKGNELITKFKYSSQDWFKAKIEQANKRASKLGRVSSSGVVDDLSGFKFTDSVDNVSSANNILKDELDAGMKFASKMDFQAYANADDADDFIARMMREADVDKNFAESAFGDSIKNTKAFKPGKTGIKFYDDLGERFRSITIGNKKVGEKLSNFYKTYINTFKQSKLVTNFSSYLNNIFGSGFMTGMSGVDVINPSNPYFNSLGDAAKLVFGSKSEKKILNRLFDNGDIATFFSKYPDIVSSMFGISPFELENMLNVEKKVRNYKFINTVGKTTTDQAADIFSTGKKILEQELSRNKMPSLNDLIGSGKLKDYVGMLGETSPDFMRFMQKLDDTINSGGAAGKAAKFARDFMTKAGDLYGKPDQTFRLGMFDFLTNTGLTQSELTKMSRFSNFADGDILKQGAKFIIKPEKAADIAMDVYLNYAAMPAAVKVFRSMPLIGSPFFSFTYGMGANTLRSLKSNPSFFPRIEYLKNSFSGDASPMEQKLINESPYYQHIKEGEMIKLPFFTENPLYLNLANMIPYYSLSLIEKSKRDYTNPMSNIIGSTIDSLPIMGDPVGNTLFDYFILPYVLQETAPQNSFSGLLYPEDANGLEKNLLYPMRNIIESVVPSMFGYAGLATGTMAPEANSELFPSYRWRTLHNAVQGKSQYGIPTKESAASRTLRALSGMAGLPVNQVNTEYLSK